LYIVSVLKTSISLQGDKMPENIPTKDKRQKERVAYGLKVPTLTFQEAIQIVKDTARLGGLAGSFDALGKTTGNSTSSSNFEYKVSALKSYGLLTIQNGDMYALTDIGKRIVQPQSPEEESAAIVEAFTTHTVLSRIWENYKGKVLPQKEYLANYIGKSLQVPNALSFQWAVYFYEAASFAKILDVRESGSVQVLSRPLNLRVFTAEITEPIEPPVIEPKPFPIPQSPQPQSFSSLDEEHWGLLNKKKISKDRRAIFAIPDELTQQDIDSLRIVIKGIDSMLDGLKKDAE
jgi:hypothetical protein